MNRTVLKLLVLANYILIILHLCLLTNDGTLLGIESIAPFFIVSIMLIDITYISACNIRENKVISLFCCLLSLNSWYILLPFEKTVMAGHIFNALSPIIWYVSVRFIFMFLFQSSGYKFRKTVNIILLLACIGSIVGLCISEQTFALMYGIQFILNICCFLFIISYHWKRVIFVLKSEWKCILFSVALIAISFLAYYFATLGVQDHIANFGIYLPVLLFFMSVHGIILKEHCSVPLSTVFSRKQLIIIICTAIGITGIVIVSLGGGYEELLIAINLLFIFIYAFNIVLEHNLKQGANKTVKESNYNVALKQLQKEESLKTEFANFLHDDVLQDLLSVKNMMTKAHRPEIQDIIIETLDSLNIHIREQMQDYHPVILKNLTEKQNYQNLLESISQTFPQKKVSVSFDCSDTMFLVEPYNVLIYRLIKELVTNIYKHSDGNRAWITLMQHNDIIQLSISDNGTIKAVNVTSVDKTKHKGIASIMEQICSMNGFMTISNNTPHGISIQIEIPMKGDGSYQYFVS